MNKNPVGENPNPYLISDSTVKDPPQSLRETIKYLGPGFILSAGIVGSGELIATTTLGARAGFVTFWVILVSCFVKVALQLEFGKHAINTGESTMASLNKLPGPKLGVVSWSICTWLFLMIFKLLQVGGIVGGVALTLNIAFDQISVSLWTWIVAFSVSLLVFRGYYQFVEKFSIIMIGFFTIFTFISLAYLQYTPFAISWVNILEGLQFKLPPEAVVFAIAAFGITGVGGDEIMYYNYWCIEKGYATYTGPRKNTVEWTNRAKGWIKVMYIDALLAMLVYTLVTAAFYLLGAAVLHAQSNIPQGYAMVEILSEMYTKTLGAEAKAIYLLGAFVVLYSTLFAGLAAWTRVFSDTLGQMGLINFYDPRIRMRTIAILAWVFPIIWSLLFLFIKLPVLMVMIGGVSTSIILLLVVFAAFHFRYKRLSEQLKPSKFYDTAFWTSAIVIVLIGVYGIYKII